MYWCSPLPARRLQPAEGYNPHSSCTSRSIYQYVGANPTEGYNLHSFSSCSWKGATTPLALVLADMFTSTQVPAYDLCGTTFHTFSYWIHKTIIIVVQPASSITEILKHCQQHSHQNTEQTQNSAMTIKPICNFKYHASHCIRYLDEPNLRVYALLPRPTRVQICKFNLKTLQLYQTSKHTQIIIINMRQQIQSIHRQTI